MEEEEKALTVGKLIELLNKYPKDFKVCGSTHGDLNGGWFGVEEIEETHLDNGIVIVSGGWEHS